MKKLLTTFVEVVVFLFSAFGGFLTNIAPPPQANASYAVGIGSFFVLLILLIVSAIAREAPTEKFRKRWILSGTICFIIALPFGISYPWVLGKLTYSYPPLPDQPVAQHVNGWELTEEAKEYVKENPESSSPGQLELKLPYEEIWTASSLSKAKMILLLNYTVLILVLSTAVFCLLEANIGGAVGANEGPQLVTRDEEEKTENTNAGSQN